jgi:hypothetical protein
MAFGALYNHVRLTEYCAGKGLEARRTSPTRARWSIRMSPMTTAEMRYLMPRRRKPVAGAVASMRPSLLPDLNSQIW